MATASVDHASVTCDLVVGRSSHLRHELHGKGGSAVTTVETRPEPSPTAPEVVPPERAWPRRALLAAVVLGILWRLVQWWSNASLWLDEASIAENIIGRSYGGLAQPLRFEQGAPVGWLWIERTLSLLFGSSERALRLWPLLAGVATVFVAWALARRLLGPVATAAYVAMVALWPVLVQYSGELKQYSTDTLASALILLFGLRVVRREHRARLHLAVAGTALLWLSHPAVICLAGVGLFLGVDDLRRRDRPGIKADLLTALAWSVTLAVLWKVALADLSHSVVADGWKAGYAPSPAHPFAWAQFVRHETMALFGIGASWLRLAVSVLLVIGALRFARRAPGHFALLASVPALALIASQLKRYPYIGDRPSLYLVPVFFLWIAAAIPEPAHTIDPGPQDRQTEPSDDDRSPPLTAGRRSRGNDLAAVVVAIMVVTGIYTTADAWWLVNPLATRHEARPLLRRLAAADDGRTPVYLYRFSGTAYRYYGRRFDLPTPVAAFRLADADRRDPAVSRISACRGPLRLDRSRRIWVIYTFPDPLFPGDFGRRINILRPLGTVRRSLRERGAAAFEIDLAPNAAAHYCRLSPVSEGIDATG
ncbi:MAG: glycosyltransferase family 39 protein [Acidimicrobiales bacterium]